MKYLYPDRVFWKIAMDMPRPGLSIIPYLHKRFVTDSVLIKPNRASFDKSVVCDLRFELMSKGSHHPVTPQYIDA